MVIKSAIDQIDSDRSERFLLSNVFFVQHAHVNEDFGGLGAGLGLETDAQPAAAFFTTGRDGVGKDEKSSAAPPFFSQALEQKIVFVIEHGTQPAPADVTVRGTVNGIADCHIVGGNGFGDGPRRAAGAKEATRHFLAGAHFGEGAVTLRIVIDALRLLTGIELFSGHSQGKSKVQSPQDKVQSSKVGPEVPRLKFRFKVEAQKLADR